MSEFYPDDLDDFTSELFKWIDENPVLTMKNQIINQYGQEFSAIKHISDKTAYAINTLNENRDKLLSIKDIKDAYTAAGKNLETVPSDVNMANFDKYKDAVDGIKQAQSLEGKAKDKEKALLNPSMSKVMEMAQ